MNIYCTLTRKGIAAMIATLILGIMVCGELSAVSKGGIKGDTNHRRIAFISSLGIETEQESTETKEIVIPSVFGDVYENYNLIQKKAGFDLEAYKGLKVTRYTYLTSDGERAVNLLVFNGRVIGGDVCETELGGEMLPLMKGSLNGKTET